MVVSAPADRHRPRYEQATAGSERDERGEDHCRGEPRHDGL